VRDAPAILPWHFWGGVEFPRGDLRMNGMERLTQADRRTLALALMVILALSAATIGSIGWGAVLVAKATVSSAQSISGV
jgi:hypothetical protein